MSKYYEKAAVIEAVRFNGSSTHRSQIHKWMAGGPLPKKGGIHTRDLINFDISVLGDIVTVSPGDFIAKQANGSFYAYKPDIFYELFEKV